MSWNVALLSRLLLAKRMDIPALAPSSRNQALQSHNARMETMDRAVVDVSIMRNDRVYIVERSCIFFYACLLV